MYWFAKLKNECSNHSLTYNRFKNIIIIDLSILFVILDSGYEFNYPLIEE